MEEASNLKFGDQLRDIFCSILLYCFPAERADYRADIFVEEVETCPCIRSNEAKERK